MKAKVLTYLLFFYGSVFIYAQKLMPLYSELDSVELSSGKLLRYKDFPSVNIKQRNVDIWIPDDYSSQKKYAVLYMHDGQMLFDSTSTWNKQEWSVDEVASRLMNKKKVRDFIVVGVWNIPEIRHSDYFPKKPFRFLPQKTQDSLLQISIKQKTSLINLNADNYLKFLVDELKPVVDRDFATFQDSENTAVMGSSMGGLISMYAVSEYPNIFGSAACLSTHWIGTYTSKNNPVPEAFFRYMEKFLPGADTHNIYFDYGTATLDELYLPYQQKVTEIIGVKGHKINKKFDGHDHSEISWGKRLAIPLTFLFGKKDE